MTFRVREDIRPGNAGAAVGVYVLEDGLGNFVEIAPSLGFNAYRWHVALGELLYATPEFFQENKPTRSGVPILFPFPNRIRDGRFAWQGKNYQLPTNDPSGKNAIHGFVCRKPWRITGQGADGTHAWLSGEFVGSREAPETLELWPADYRLKVTYDFRGHELDVHAAIHNPGQTDLPYGLGYHPYFALSLFGGEETEVSAPARKFWELIENLPTGRRLPVDANRDLRSARRYESLRLDDVYTELDIGANKFGLALSGLLAGAGRRLEIHTSELFRELVGFTPPHRHAICLEPYTCVTDAINLEAQGIDAGWRVLAPGQKEESTMRFVFRETS